jgi:tetratricopeptide (TPR) repeat protein
MSNPKGMTFEDVASALDIPIGVTELVMIAERFATVGNYAQAVNAIQRALTLAPNDWVLIHKMGNWLVDGGYYNDALNIFQKSIYSFPDNHNLAFGMSATLGWLERYEESHTWALKACELNPGNPTYENYKNFLDQRKPFGVVRFRVLSEPDDGKLFVPYRQTFNFTIPAMTPSGFQNVTVATVRFDNTHFLLSPTGIFEIKLNDQVVSTPTEINLGDKVQIGTSNMEFIRLDTIALAVE